ncbi:DNA utilization family protein [Tatumella saanichensis]|uniref:DNA utilization family protein n=1 Tax=Tatumella saanichensis TaxID=480813 RepID=UPI0006881A0A|nr:DNA utilization family protein [Tatumella saanichensis]
MAKRRAAALLCMVLLPAEGRDPFQPPPAVVQCQPAAISLKGWQLRGTVISPAKRRARLSGPNGSYYSLGPGETLPNTLWQVTGISRRLVILSHRAGCLPVRESLSLQVKETDNGQDKDKSSAVVVVPD